MVSGAAIHFLIGAAAGLIFGARTLLLLVAGVVLECVLVTILFGLAEGAWSLAWLATLQIGYLVGICARSVLERIGWTHRKASTRRLS